MSLAKTDRQNAVLLLIFFNVVLLFAMAIEWYVNVLFVTNKHHSFFDIFFNLFVHPKAELLFRINRVIFLPLLLLAFKVGMTQKQENPERFKIFAFPMFTCAIPMLIGYLGNATSYYNFYFIPISILTTIIFAAIFAKSFVTQKLNQKQLGLVSCKNKNLDMSFDFNVLVNGVKQILRIHSPQQGIYIQGGAGSGKSASIFEPILGQSVLKGFAGYIYDFKGSESPLSKVIYNTLQHRKDEITKAGYPVPTFHYINVTRPFASTGKVNPLNPKYLTTNLHCIAASNVLYRNLDKSAIGKSDFWIANAKNFISGCIIALKNRQEKYPDQIICTIPHLISLLLSPMLDTINFLSDDPEVAPTIQSIIQAKENEAGSQLSGIESTFQTAVTKLYNKDIYWFFSPLNESEEIDLRLNDKNNPTMLCICNHETLMDALSPVIGLVTSSVISILNDLDDPKDFYKTLLAVDELPTQFIDKLDFVPATMRSKKVVTCVGVQDYSQLKRDYGDKQAPVVVANLGNQFYGMNNDIQNSENIAKMFGEYDKLTESNSYSDSGASRSESEKKEKVKTATEISNQPIGHFSGKIADGDPALYSCQFDDGRIHVQLGLEEEEIQDIPNSNYPVKDNFDNEKQRLIFQKGIYKKQSEANFERVIKDIADILEEYAEEEIDTL